MQKWNYLVLAGGWTLTMVYEWFWRPGLLGTYVALGLLLDGAAVGAFLWERWREKKHGPREPISKWVYFTAALLVCVLFVLGLDRVEFTDPPHILLLPLYVVLTASSIFFGCRLWYLERRNGREYRARAAKGEPVWKNNDLPKGGGN